MRIKSVLIKFNLKGEIKMNGNTANFYLPGADIPKIFLEADRQMAWKNQEEEIVTEPIEVPMPFIHGTPGVRGPLVITKDWYVKAEKERLAKRSKMKRDFQIEMMQLIAQRDQINMKLGELDPAKKKDAKKIVWCNIKLKDIDAELQMLQAQSHIDLNELEHGTQFARFVGAFKRKIHKVKKKIKKFFKTYEEPITALITVAVPIIIATAVKCLMKLLI